jgi:hypothetical protein
MIRFRIFPLASGLVLASVAVVLSLKVFGTAGFSAMPKDVLLHDSGSCRECSRVAGDSDFKVAPKGFSDLSLVTPSSLRAASSRGRVLAQTLSTSAKIESGKSKIPATESSSLQEEISETPLPTAVSLPEKDQIWAGVNHRLPGNYLHMDGKRGEIQQYQKSPGSVGVGLVLDVVPDDETNREPGDTASSSPELITQTGTQASPVNVKENPVGFTYEEELFRTKWGWAAFDQVRKTIREDATQ